MEYTFEEFTIEDLIKLIKEDKIDLNPSYQRNFIWSTKDQSDLIDTIILKYPIPNFFLYENPAGGYEMVDGQQRSKTILRFVNGNIKSSSKTGQIDFNNCDKSELLNYRLPFIVIRKLSKGESLNEFYVLINKTGKFLNNPEVHKSAYYDKKFMKLANEMLSYQNFIELNLFTDATSKRMNDRDFVQELLGYLKLGIIPIIN